MALIKITDITAQLDISSRSLRYYEQMSLIQSIRPKFEKYRYFDDENIERLKQIIVLRKMQIPIKDIIRIYESHDMSVVVETFVNRINAIEDEINALSEMKRITNEFLQTMLKNGIKKISSLPLLYEEMDKQLEVLEEHKPVTYEGLSAVSEKLKNEIEVFIIELPQMRMLSSKQKDNSLSDVEGFTDWMELHNIPRSLPGSHELFEYQDNKDDTIIIRRIDNNFINDSPYIDIIFNGGLFAVGSVFVDEDIGAFHFNMMKSLDNNLYYKVDYQHDGNLRHESLLESVLSPDEKREKVNIFLAVKKRMPEVSLYESNEQIKNITVDEIEKLNPILWTKEFSIDDEIVHMQPGKSIPTGITVHYPLRVDIDFRIDDEKMPQYSGAGRGIPCVLFEYGDEYYGVNMDDNSHTWLYREAIAFTQPIIKNKYNYPQLGKINIPDYNRLTWIIGAKHFAVILNDEVRYCGINFPYMKMVLTQQIPHEIMVNTRQGEYKVFFKNISVSQLKMPLKKNIKKGVIRMVTRQSNNILPDIREIVDGGKGENYTFADCMAFLMERSGRPDIGYWVFVGITGDSVTQIYNKNNALYRDNASQYLVGPKHVKHVFDAIGYEYTYITAEQINANKTMYLQTLMAYIDNGVPVIATEDVRQGIKAGSEECNQFLIVGYEDNGKTLLVHLNDPNKIKKYETTNIINQDWIFVGEKKYDVPINDILKNAVFKMKHWLTLPEQDGVCFGAMAFRAWADDIENGRYDDDISLWGNYTCYICNLSSNAANAGVEPDFIRRFAEVYPEYTEMYQKITAQYKKLSNGPGQTWKELEDLSGGFNVKYEALRNKENRVKIAAELRKAGEVLDEVVRILNEYLPEAK
ncbi:MAG: hypothetical protein A2Y17_04900 [Clostridiales bacterium GWF2_38_85]|nr:MAG: hypothetical protein A2Y17_04900 [Clostridiales bacterium GWF2_38_85]HBL84374.1 hypothetical protein [Clostridiales bacterium]